MTNASPPPVEPGSMRARLRDADKAWREASANYHEVMAQVEAAYMNGEGNTPEVRAMSRAASDRYAEALTEVVAARKAIPTFEEMLADPTIQVDPTSEILASIKEYSEALPATAGMPVRCPKCGQNVAYSGHAASCTVVHAVLIDYPPTRPPSVDTADEAATHTPHGGADV